MTYAWLSAAFLTVAVVVAGVGALRARPTGRKVRRGVAAVAASAVVLVALTAVFDNLMIAAGLMQYSPRHIMGLRVGAAPIEDFAYPVAAAILLPALFSLMGPAPRRRGR